MYVEYDYKLCYAKVTFNKICRFSFTLLVSKSTVLIFYVVIYDYIIRTFLAP